jgi:thiamine pyrophosphate-dependent acetolactate synthase large subunit-like protein
VTHTGLGVDLVGIASASGFTNLRRVAKPEEVPALREAIHNAVGPFFATVKIDPTNEPLALPPRDGVYLTTRFRGALLGDAAHLE